MKMHVVHALKLCVISITIVFAFDPSLIADETISSETDTVQPLLEADTEVARILQDLGDNECAQLPPAKIHGEFNAMAKKHRLHERGPGSRDYCLKMPYAPDRQRALYCGGNHGVPHKLNDIWEYDLASNTWVMLRSPDFNSRRDYQDNARLHYEDGVVKTDGGNLVVRGHTFSGITYDPVAKMMLWRHKNISYDLPDKPSDPFAGPYLWGFDPQQQKWEFIGTSGPFPSYDPGSGFNYVPSLKMSVWSNNRSNDQLWAYDHATKSWEQLPVKGGFDNAPRMSAQKVYDAKHDRLIAHGGHSNYTSEFDFETNTWTKTVVANQEQTNAPKGADKLSTFAYDSHNGVCLLCDNLGGYIWVYDAGRLERKWERLEPKNSEPHRREQGGISKGSKFTPMGFFHPHYNVLVLLDGGKTVWVYRYKRRPA